MDITQRILKNGKPLCPSLYTWDEKTKTFTTDQSSIVADFTDVQGVTLKAGWNSALTAGSNSTLTAGNCSALTAGSNSTLKAGGGSTLTAGSNSTLTAGDFSTLKAGDFSALTADWNSTLEAGNCSALTAGWRSTLKAGNYSTLTAGNNSTLTAGNNSTLKAGNCSALTADWNSTLEAGGSATLTAGGGSTLTAGDYCAFVRHWQLGVEVVTPEPGQVIQFFPYHTKGYLVDGLYNGKPHIIADGIVSEILHQRGNIYRVRNIGENADSWLLTDGENWAHGDTLKEAQEDLIYKTIPDFGGNIPDKATGKEWVGIYRAITKACSKGVRLFVENTGKSLDATYTAQEIYELSMGHYGAEKFKEKLHTTN